MSFSELAVFIAGIGTFLGGLGTLIQALKEKTTTLPSKSSREQRGLTSSSCSYYNKK